MRKNKILKICEFCNNEFLTSDSRNKFCSLNCFHKKRSIPDHLRKQKEKEWKENRKKKICTCGKSIISYSTICSSCFKKKRKDQFEQKMNILTINDCMKISKKYSACNKYQNIRNYAQSQMNWNNIKKECKICKYDKHVEACHIKPISSFDKKTVLKEVNSLNNLVYLCPNHHWELDNKIITI